jgi:GNAT superfamily N-acetyltransferase
VTGEGWRYGRNAAAMWSALGPERTEVVRDRPEYALLRMRLSGTLRLLVRRPLTALPPELLDLLSAGGRVFVEDPFGDLALPGNLGLTSSDLPVMVRPAGGTVDDGAVDGDTVDGGTVGGGASPGTHVTAASDTDTLVAAERVMVESYPLPALQPFSPGAALPPRVLRTPGWGVWLARRAGAPVSACFGYDDGETLGLYWLATAEEARGAGMGRAVMAAALGAHPGRGAVLVSTEASAGLYRRLGFRDTGVGRMHVRRG